MIIMITYSSCLDINTPSRPHPAHMGSHYIFTAAALLVDLILEAEGGFWQSMSWRENKELLFSICIINYIIIQLF